MLVTFNLEEIWADESKNLLIFLIFILLETSLQ